MSPRLTAFRLLERVQLPDPVFRVLPKTHEEMMLADKDRIFTNLYGFHDWRLAGARARGAWDNNKARIDTGQDAIINEMKASGLRRRARAGRRP